MDEKSMSLHGMGLTVLIMAAFLIPLFTGAATQCPQLTRNLSYGSRGNDVVQLQDFLITQGDLAAGNNTGYFGNLTRSAVRKFQCREMNICSGGESTNGYGSVGPRTRAKIAGVCAGKIAMNLDACKLPLEPRVVSPKKSLQELRAVAASNQVTLKFTEGTGIRLRDGILINMSAPDITAFVTILNTYGIPMSAVTRAYSRSEADLDAERAKAQCMSGRALADANLYYKISLLQGTSAADFSYNLNVLDVVEFAEPSPVPGPLPSLPQSYTSLCTADVRQCPDGSYVSRTGPSCQFAACPASISKGQITSQTSLNIPASSISYPATSLLDFLVQDVCVDGNNNPIAGDPAMCSQHRDMKFGEFIPYQKTDKSWGNLYQSAFSYPTQAPNGSLLIMKAMEFGGTTPGSAFRDFDIFSPAIDGFDLLEANGAYVSNIASQDPEGLKPFWNPQCSHEDTWIAFPSDLQPGVNGNTNAFKLAAGLTCPSQFSPALNIWHYYDTPLTYTSGKSLESIVSWHYDTDDTTQIKAYEQFYFTREYGETRWERWETPEFCRSYAPTVGIDPDVYCVPETASGSCNGAADLPDVFGHRMIRVACRDWSQTSAMSVAFNPLTNPLGGWMVQAKNILKAGDFAQGRSDGWQKFGAPPVSFEVKKDSGNNWYLETACMAGCTGENNSIYQDISAAALSGKKKVLFGAILSASKETTATISVHILGSQGQRIGGKNTIMHVGTSAQHRDDSLDWDFSSEPAATIRYQIYLNDLSARYTIDEAYVTPIVSAQ